MQKNSKSQKLIKIFCKNVINYKNGLYIALITTYYYVV